MNNIKNNLIISFYEDCEKYMMCEDTEYRDFATGIIEKIYKKINELLKYATDTVNGSINYNNHEIQFTLDINDVFCDIQYKLDGKNVKGIDDIISKLN